MTEADLINCLRRAQNYADEYMLNGHKLMADWWLDQAEYYEGRLIEVIEKRHGRTQA